MTALILGRPELVALGAPFALLLVVGLALGPPAEIAVAVNPGPEPVVEGEEIEAELVIGAPARAATLQVAPLLPAGIRQVDNPGPLLLRLQPGHQRSLPLKLTGTRWGAYNPYTLFARTSDATGLRSLDQLISNEALLRVYPASELLPAAISPAQTQLFTGNRIARTKGEGLEFADIRPYAAGDRARRINWRQSAMRQSLYVNQQHPERNTDVILFLDTFAEARHLEAGTLDLAVGAAVSLAAHYLSTRDRVGLVSFGGYVRWLTPASGTTQLYRIIDVLLESEIAFSFAWKDIDVLPPRSLTPNALVIALSPLLDERSVNALINLRDRGFDLVVVDLSPLAFTEAGDPDMQLALRLWRLWREVLRFRYEERGVAVAAWDGKQPLAQAVEEVRAFRRFARYASA
jgi:uncharacterized protein (DUF58 family)